MHFRDPMNLSYEPLNSDRSRWAPTRCPSRRSWGSTLQRQVEAKRRKALSLESRLRLSSVQDARRQLAARAVTSELQAWPAVSLVEDARHRAAGSKRRLDVGCPSWRDDSAKGHRAGFAANGGKRLAGVSSGMSSTLPSFERCAVRQGAGSDPEGSSRNGQLAHARTTRGRFTQAAERQRLQAVEPSRRGSQGSNEYAECAEQGGCSDFHVGSRSHGSRGSWR